jgi:hypothetical protein
MQNRSTHLAIVFAETLNWRAAAALPSPPFNNTEHHGLSTFRRQGSILVRVHSVLRESLLVWRLQNSRSGGRMDNLLKAHS